MTDTESNPIHGETTLDDVNVTATQPAFNPNFGPPGIGASDDPLSLVIKGTKWEGWQQVRVTRSVDNIPAVFELTVTERYPTSGQIDIKPGDPCQVMIGNDLAITGYVDRYAASLDAQNHTVHITGRSKSADLVDCAAFVGSQDNESYLIPPGTTVSIIKQLAQGYGIEVNSLAGDGPQVTTPFSINLGETAWEIIDRLIRFSQFLAYDMPDGSLVLAQVGKEAMASGFVQGQNIEAAEVTYTMDQRYSLYKGFMTSTNVFTLGQGTQMNPDATAKDNDVPRFRKRIIISSQSDAQGPLVQRQVDWEMARRKGRSLAVAITTDSWRDSAGALWAPNHLAPIDLPALKVPANQWCIGAVTYVRDENGQHALVVLMPPDAFKPEPTAFMPLPLTSADVGAGTYNPTAPNAGAANPPPPPPNSGSSGTGSLPETEAI